jgi:uncharacterized membrane protein (UPF0127 family)
MPFMNFLIRFIPVLILVVGACAASAQFLRPHEPFDSTKAQTLPLEPGAIVTAETEHVFQFEFANTDRSRQIGLMHRAEIAPDRGMLFDFARNRMVGMWMRNTFIPLDMLFLSDKGEVVTIAENTIPHNETPISSRVRVRAVLELKAGTVERLGIKTGDRVKHAMFGE